MEKSTYEIVTTPMGSEVIHRLDENGTIWSIPFDELNSDYQAYLVSLEPVKTTESK